MTTLQRTAIVVGVGSEQGLGAAIARRFAAEGQRVIVSGRTEAKIARVVRAIVDSGGKAEAFTADATIESEVAALFEELVMAVAIELGKQATSKAKARRRGSIGEESHVPPKVRDSGERATWKVSQ